MSATEVLLRLVRECAALRGRIAAAAVSLLALSAAQLYLTWLAKVWADALVPQVDVGAVRNALFTAALVTAGMALAMLVSRTLLASINQGLLGRLRESLQERLLRSEVAAVRGFAAGDLTSRAFFDVGTLSGFAEMTLKRVVGEGFLLVGAIAMMLHLEWRLALAGFLVAPPLVLLVATLSRSVRRRSAIAHAEIGAASAMLAEQIAGLTTIKGFQTEDFERDRFARQSRAYAGRALHAEGWSAVLTAGVWLVTGLGLLGIAGYGTSLVAAGDITSGGLLSFCLYAIQVVEPARRMSEVLGLLQKMVAAAGRVFAVIDLPWVERGGTRSLASPVRGEIAFDGVVFAYRPERRVLDRIDLEIRPNESLALVAASGGGKSTVAALLQRFYDPVAGSIRLDGVDLRELRLDDLRRSVCVVEQEVFLFAGTLAENVRYGSSAASREAVESAIELVGLEPLIRSLPGGLEARLQEGGRDLSGGQRQRIALARAIVREPRVLVLDEATSAIDGDAEGQIFSRLSPWLARRGVIVMAHRLSTVSRFPRVVVLGDGRVLGDGATAEVARTCLPFRTLFAEQLAELPARAS